MLLAAAAFACHAEWVSCVICGGKPRINTKNSSTYGGYLTSTVVGNDDFYCTKLSCRKKAEQIKANKARKINAANSNQMQINEKRKKQHAAVNTMRSSLQQYLIQAQKSKVPAKEQIQKINSYLKQINSPFFYEAIISYAPMDVIKYYWGDKENTNTYLVSKNHRAEWMNNTKSGLAALEAVGSHIADVLTEDTSGPAKVKAVPEVAKAPKKIGTAFALGIDKKSGSVRYVENNEFTNSMLTVAIKAQRLDVLEYFVGQCEKKDCIKNFTLAYDVIRERNAIRQNLLEKIATEKEKLKTANDKFDAAQINKKITVLNNKLNTFPPKKISQKMADILWGKFSVYDSQKILSDKMQWKNSTEEEKIYKNFVDDLAMFPGDFAKWSNWIKDKANIGKMDPFMFYINEDYTKGQRKWVHTLPAVGKNGYITGINPGTIVWKSGMFHEDIVGLISDEKENTWIVAPGFKKTAEGKAVWTAGLQHPQYPGVFSTAKIFTWMPDAKHLWENPDDKTDLSARADDTMFGAIVKGAAKSNKNYYKRNNNNNANKELTPHPQNPYYNLYMHNKWNSKH